MAENDNYDRSQAAAVSVAQSLSQMTRRDPASKSAGPQCQRAYAGSFRERLQQTEEQRGTVLYLAYGSNLSNETFRGNRGIKPLSQVNVQVPSLRLTFDLPGIAYLEPCFANSARRDPENDPPKSHPYRDEIDDENEAINNEKSPFYPLEAQRQGDKYRKDRWHKGLIGVVYEVTKADYAHIIQTEGGGSSYKDILVDCHPFASTDPAEPVPQNPILAPFKAHTLFAPVAQPGEEPPKDGSGRLQRPDTSYAQPSARYLKLITDGAAELGLPYEYQDFLHSLKPYTITSRRQKLGQAAFVGAWLPVVMMIFALGRLFSDKNGRQPEWLKKLSGAIFATAWMSYDSAYKRVFGDGERTVGDDGNDDAGDGTSDWSPIRLEHTGLDIEKIAGGMYRNN